MRHNWIPSFLAIMLVLLGGCLLYFSPENSFRHHFGEASTIAGILTLLVDPFLKKRLIQEASKDIFQHLLGIDFPVPVRDSLQQALLGHTWYAENIAIELRVAQKNAERIDLEIAWRQDIVAVKDTEYAQGISFEKAEHARVEDVSLVSGKDPKLNYSFVRPDLIPNKLEPMVEEWKGDTVPLKKGDRISTYTRVILEKGEEDYYPIAFAGLALYPRVRIVEHGGLNIVPGGSIVQENVNEFLYNKVFVPGDHFVLRWGPLL